MAEPIIDKKQINLAMLGMVDGNGHPYSWSAICNGYDEKKMALCPYPTIPEYLGEQPKETLRIPDVNVTHVWCDDPEDTQKVAGASLIPNPVDKAEDVIGKVDAVVIATDRGWEHVDRARPFIEAGIPVFIDKPMCDNEEDLRTFVKWHRDGRKFMSSSSMRYSTGFEKLRNSTEHLGNLKYVTITTPKTWERYGIHALEGIYPILGPGFISVRNTGDEKRNIVHLKHSCGADIVIAAIYDMFGSFGKVMLAGDKSFEFVESGGAYHSFRAQLEAFISYLRTGEPPFDFSETIECMKIIAGGIKSRQQGGREIFLEDIKSE
ncbi:MAG: Gfo/Idh/MocA family oxidoreductase [Clostridia bacterium]